MILQIETRETLYHRTFFHDDEEKYLIKKVQELQQLNNKRRRKWLETDIKITSLIYKLNKKWGLVK